MISHEHLNRTFITPLDPEEISRLASTLDDVLDCVDGATEKMLYYDIGNTDAHMIELAKLIHLSTIEIESAVKAIRSIQDPRYIEERCIEVNRLENLADDVLALAITDLFKTSDAIAVIKLKDIYEEQALRYARVEVDPDGRAGERPLVPVRAQRCMSDVRGSGACHARILLITRDGWDRPGPGVVLDEVGSGETAVLRPGPRLVRDHSLGPPRVAWPGIGAELVLGPAHRECLVSYVHYLGKIFWPSGLAVFYPHPRAWPKWEVVTCGLLLGVICGLVLRTARRRPWLLVDWFWFLGVLVPFIGLVQAGAQAMADHFMYVPSLGGFLLAIWGGRVLAGSRRYALIAGVGPAAAAIALCLLLTRRRLGH